MGNKEANYHDITIIYDFHFFALWAKRICLDTKSFLKEIEMTYSIPVAGFI